MTTNAAAMKTVGYPFTGKKEIVQVTYDFAADGGATGVINLMKAQDDLVVERKDGKDLGHQHSSRLSYVGSTNRSPILFPVLRQFAVSDRNRVIHLAVGRGHSSG